MKTAIDKLQIARAIASKFGNRGWKPIRMVQFTFARSIDALYKPPGNLDVIALITYELRVDFQRLNTISDNISSGFVQIQSVM